MRAVTAFVCLAIVSAAHAGSNPSLAAIEGAGDEMCSKVNAFYASAPDKADAMRILIPVPVRHRARPRSTAAAPCKR